MNEGMRGWKACGGCFFEGNFKLFSDRDLLKWSKDQWCGWST